MRTCAPLVVLGLCPKLKYPQLCGGIIICYFEQGLFGLLVFLLFAMLCEEGKGGEPYAAPEYGH